MIPEFTPLLTLSITVDPAVIIDPGLPGRRYIPITGGTVSGRYAGRVLPGGDWQTIRPDGVAEIAAHYALELEGHGLVEVRSDGYRHGPAEVMAQLARGDNVPRTAYYFRTAIHFHAGPASLAFLNRMVAVALGARSPDRVLIDIFELL